MCSKARTSLDQFAAGSQTESVKMQTQELFGTGGFTAVSLVKQPERGSDDRIW
jgi:hypothetical protein